MLKSLAKKIITQAPVSVIYETQIPKVARKWLQRADEELHYQALALSDSFTTDEWRDIQLRKLKNILVHAGDNVPFWKRTFKELGFDPKHFKNLDDLDKLPIVSRADFKSISREYLFAYNIPENRRVGATTSGSTAEPFAFFNDRRDVFRRKVNVFYELTHAGIPTKSNALILGLESLKGLRHYPLHINPLELESRDWRISTFYPLLTSVRPQLLVSTPSHMIRLADLCRRDGFNYFFRAMRFYGEIMHPSDQEELESFFGCKIFSTYGSHECSIIGTECKDRNMHTIPWLNYVEIVDDNGKSVPNGNTGRIVVTFFENECMPFIRYDLGDHGSGLDEKCACGRSSRLLKFSGRKWGLLDLKNGETYPASFIGKRIANQYAKEVRKFQIEQTSIGQVLLRIVPMSRISSARVGEIEEALVGQINSPGTIIHIEIVDCILPDKNGKTPLFIKKADPAALDKKQAYSQYIVL